MILFSSSYSTVKILEGDELPDELKISRTIGPY